MKPPWYLLVLVVMGAAILPSSLGWVTLWMEPEVRSDLAAGLLTSATVGYVLVVFERKQEDARDQRAAEQLDAVRHATVRMTFSGLRGLLVDVAMAHVAVIESWWQRKYAAAARAGTAESLLAHDMYGQPWADQDVLLLSRGLRDVAIASQGYSRGKVPDLQWTWVLLMSAACDLFPENSDELQPLAQIESSGLSLKVDEVLGSLQRFGDVLLEGGDPDRAQALFDVRQGLRTYWDSRSVNAHWGARVTEILMTFLEGETIDPDVSRRRLGKSDAEWWSNIESRRAWMRSVRQAALGGSVALSPREDPQRSTRVVAVEEAAEAGSPSDGE